MTNEMLEIVDANDNVVDIAPRADIHAKGLLHREINVLFVTLDGNGVFQRRARKDKPFGWLDATAGGHVDIGESYRDAALREVQEETGLILRVTDLYEVGRIAGNEAIPDKQFLNKSIKPVYGYLYHGSVADLIVETGKAEGFELFPLAQIFDLPKEIKAQFIPSFVDPQQFKSIYHNLLNLIGIV